MRDRVMKEMIRKIPKHPEVPLLTNKLMKSLTDLYFIDLSLDFVETFFIFGSNILHREIAKIISEYLSIYNSPTIVLSGGIANYEDSSYQNIAESILIEKHITKSKFPLSKFITEDRSKIH